MRARYEIATADARRPAPVGCSAVAGTESSASRPRLGEGREAEILEWDDGRVLRLLRDPSARDRLDREAVAVRAAEQAGIPVPSAFDTIVVDGRPGLVMERVDGADLMTALSRRPWRIIGAARQLGRLQARLHDAVAPAALPDLRETLRERVDTAPHLPPRLRAHVLALLAELPDGDRICHMDLHPGNVIFGERGPVVIDWANATRGDPVGDLARTILILRCAAVPGDMSSLLRAVDRVGRSMFRRVWVRGYRETRAPDVAVVDRWETVCAAARLCEGIDEEVPALLALLEARARDS
jgi:aminoglycoside phosphotransferase (APT) family kinase protein